MEGGPGFAGKPLPTQYALSYSYKLLLSYTLFIFNYLDLCMYVYRIIKNFAIATKSKEARNTEDSDIEIKS